MDNRFSDPIFQAGWNAWLAGKGGNDNPHREAGEADRWEAGRMAAAHET
jgi:hypothetical protein